MGQCPVVVVGPQRLGNDSGTAAHNMDARMYVLAGMDRGRNLYTHYEGNLTQDSA